jgi:hypothetical protein
MLSSLSYLNLVLFDLYVEKGVIKRTTENTEFAEGIIKIKGVIEMDVVQPIPNSSGNPC